MNPAVLNYLQNQQQPNQTPGMEQAQLQQVPQQQAQVPQQAYNPFDAGINKAISSARESLGMTDKQQGKALRRSMLAFGDNIAQQPKQKGFWNNFGSVGRALSPAIQEYDNAEDAALTQNNAIANQILAHQAAEDRRLEQAEEKAWNRQRAEDQFAQQRNLNNAKLDIYGLQANKLKRDLDPRELDSSLPQAYDDKTLAYIRKKNVDHSEEMYKANNVSKITTQALGDIRDILEEERSNNSWQQGSSTTAQLSRFMAKTAGMNDAQKSIELKRMPLFDSLKQKFGARITNMDLELFMKALPGLDQPADVAIKELDQRINDEKAALQERSIRQEIVETEFNNSVPFYSDLVSRRVDEELTKLEDQNQNIDLGQTSQSPVLMQDQSGQQYSIPRNEVEEAINDGFTPIGGNE